LGSRVPDRETPRLTLLGSPGGSGAIPIGYTHACLLAKESDQAQARSPPLLGTRGAHPSLKLPIDGSLDPILGSLPVFDASQGPSSKRGTLSHQGSGGSQRCPTGVALSTDPIGSCMRHGTRRQTPLLASGAQGLRAHSPAPQAGRLRHQECNTPGVIVTN
jgi:hypothetical protein